MSVAIIVPNYNQKKLVEEFVQELIVQEYRDFYCYVFDNSDQEDQNTDYLSDKYDWFENIQTGGNIGFAEGNNVAIRKAIQDGHEYIWIVNNDVRLERDCLKKLVDYLSKKSDVGVVSPKIMYESDRKRIWFAGGKIDWSKPFPYSVNSHYGEGDVDQGQYEQVTEPDFISGCSMFCRTEVLQKTGGFDNRYFAYFEDADLSLRIKKLGYKLAYLPSAKMYHMVGMLSGVSSPRSSYYQIRNSLLFIKEYGTKKSYMIAYLNLGIIIKKSLIKLLIPSKREFAIAHLKAARDAVLSRYGGPVDL